MDRRWLSIGPNVLQLYLTINSYLIWYWAWQPSNATDGMLCQSLSDSRYIAGMLWVIVSLLLQIYSRIALRPTELVKGLGFYVISSIFGEVAYIAHNVTAMYFFGQVFYNTCRHVNAWNVVTGTVITTLVFTLLQALVFLVYLAIVSSPTSSAPKASEVGHELQELSIPLSSADKTD